VVDVIDGDETAESPESEAATIKSVERAARILGFFTPGRPRLTLAEMTSRLGVSKATAHRYAMVLRRVNLLRYDRASGQYTLGPQILTLAAAARSGLPMINLAGPLMERLVREVNETVVLSVWDGEAPIVVRVDDGTERILRISVRAGARLELDSSQGRAFCAFLPAEDVPGLEAQLTADPQLAEELRSIREHGVATSSPARHGVRTIAVPVFGGGEIVAVLGLVGTTATLSDDVSSPTAKALKQAARLLTEQLGEADADDPAG
jgi:IclR family pca regulon transcriptional regulator